MVIEREHTNEEAMARLDTTGEMSADRNKLDDSREPLGSELKQKMYESGQAAREKLGEQTEALTEKAVNLSEQQKSIGAKQLASVASAVHTAAGELEQQMPHAANLVHAAADGLNSAATALRERRIDELLTDVGDFARERPLLVFGGAVLAGFAMTRFVKSSATTTPKDASTRAAPRASTIPTGDTINRDYEGTA
jgi:hypothetical protein